MKRKIRVAGMLALVAGTALLATGCSSSGGDNASSNGKVSMTFWHNSTTGPGKVFWEKTVADFEKAHPGVTIKIQAIQNEDLDGKLQTALNSGSAPDIFLQRGGGKMAAMADAGQLMDISGSIDSATKSAVSNGAFKGESYNGKVYAMPADVLPEGIYYSQDLFKAAGITDAAHHHERAERRHHQAEGDRRRSRRRRRQGRLARSPLVLQLRSPRVQRVDAREVGQVAEVRRQLLDEGRRRPRRVQQDAAVQRRLPHHRPPSRAPAARPVCWRTTRPRWN